MLMLIQRFLFGVSYNFPGLFFSTCFFTFYVSELLFVCAVYTFRKLNVLSEFCHFIESSFFFFLFSGFQVPDGGRSLPVQLPSPDKIYKNSLPNH